MEKKYGKSWMHRTFRFWTAAVVVILVGKIAVEGSSEICKQQEESSFHLRKLSSTVKSSQKCAELCCKDSKCTIPLQTKHHCYGIACAKKELCQVIFEQLKNFQGHRVDKREAEDDDDEEHDQSYWQNDHGRALSIYKKQDTESVHNETVESFVSGIESTQHEGNFPAFLITRERRNLLEENNGKSNSSYNGANSFMNQTTKNQFFVTLNDSVYDLDGKRQTLVKRSSADDDDDDDDEENSDEDDVDGNDDNNTNETSCSKDSKFHKSTIPERNKNYHLKRLAKRSTSLSSCSKKCCKTDSCILSFIVEKTCLGILCNGDGDCHTKKEKLPEMHFAISTVKREASLDDDGSTENDEQKRSAVQSKDDEDVDGDVDEDDEDEEEEKEKKEKKQKKEKKKKHVQRSHGKTHRKEEKKKKKSSTKHNKIVHKERKKGKAKKRHEHRSFKKKSHLVHKPSKKEKDEEDSSGSGQTESSSKRHRISKGKLDEENAIENSEDTASVGRRYETIADDANVERNNEIEKKNEYTDDVKHLIFAKKPRNSTLFDDTVVGSEKEANDPDGGDSPARDEDPIQRVEEEEPDDRGGQQEEKVHLPNLDGEQAGMGDESMKMRESSVENDKRSDLMVEHRQYEDVEERPVDNEDEDGDGEEAPRTRHHQSSNRHNKHHRWQHDKYVDANHHKKKHDYWDRGSHHRTFRHRSHSQGYSSPRQEEFERARYLNDGPSHKDHSSIKENDEEQPETRDEHAVKDSDETSGHYEEQPSSKVLALSHDDNRGSKQHAGPSISHEKHSKASRKSHIHSSKKHRHKGKKKAKEPKKHHQMNREEELIAKLEHLEEKIEKKQKNEVETRKEKILQKVEKLASTLEKKTSTKSNSKIEEKDEESSGQEDRKKSKSKLEKKGETVPDLESSRHAAKKEDVEPEKIEIPPNNKHKKKSKKKGSKKESKNHHNQKEKEKLESISSRFMSGEGSSLNVMQHQSEASGVGEDNDGVEAHYLGFERDHGVEDSNWSQRNVVIPYINKKSHHGSHQKHDTYMPVLNENILDGLDKMRYDKKDKIAKPSDNDKVELKGEIKRARNYKEFLKLKANAGKPDKKSEHHTRKSSSKSSHKSKSKKEESKDKKGSNSDKLKKEFERYKAFVKAQEMAMSGEGSGDGKEGSGSKEVSIPVLSGKKSKSHKKSKSKASHKHKKSKHKDSKSHKHRSSKKHLPKAALILEGSGSSENLVSIEEGSGVHEKKDHHEKTKHHSRSKKKHVKVEGNVNGNEQEGTASKKSYSNISNTNTTLSNGTKEDEEHKTEVEKPKMFLDRKESAAGEAQGKNHTIETVPENRNHSKTSHDVPTAHVSVSNKLHGEVISERNTTWKNAESRSSANTTTGVGHNRIQNSLNHAPSKSSKAIARTSAENTKKAPAVVPTTKAIITTTIATTDKPPLRVHVTSTALPKTTRTSTTQRKTLPATTKPLTAKKRFMAKKKPHKTTPPPTRRLTTTSIPTLSILTGDEDVEEEKKEPTSRRKMPTRQHSTKTKERKKPSKTDKKINISKNTSKVHQKKAPSREVLNQRLITTSKPISFVPSVPVQPLSPTVNIFQNRAMSQQLAGPGGSTGILGDLQLPEPPGTGNVASGPPFYGQQGIPARLPVQGPLGQMQYHQGQQGKILNNGMIQGAGIGDPSSRNDFHKTLQGSHVQQMPPTAKTFQTFDYGGSSPLPKPTSIPQNYITTALKPPIAPSQKQLYNKIPESPQNVINRILGEAHKPSPIQVIQHILKPKQKQKDLSDLHPVNMKPTMNKEPKAKGPGATNVNANKPEQNQHKEKPPPKVPTIPRKKPSSTVKRPSIKPKPPSKGQKKPMAKLNDFFKKVDNIQPQKTTEKPTKVTVPKPNIPKKKAPESSAPISPKDKPEAGSCPVRQNLENMVLSKGRKSGEFTRMQGYPTLDKCIKQCCKTPTCDLLFKSGEVCYLVHCHNHESCKTEPLKEPTIRTRIVFVKKPNTNTQTGKPAICQGENAFGILWKETKPGHFATRSCPREAKGFAKRQCNDHSQWLTPDFGGCVSDQYTNLNEDVKHLGFTASVKDVLAKLEEITTQTIDNSLVFGGDIIKASNILDEVSKFVQKNHAERFGFGALRNFARSASNLLDVTNKQEWENVNRSLKGPGKIMRALENFSVVTAGKIPPINNNQPIITNNMVLSVARHSRSQKYVFPNYSMPFLKRWTTKKDQIILPGHLFKAGVVKVASVNYKNLAPLLPHQWNSNNHVTFTDGFRVNSKVIATSIRPEPTKKIDPPVTIILHHLKESNSARTKCVYWDFNSNPQNGGGWSSNGCWVVTSNSTVTVCQCEHLTHFAVLMNLSDEDRVSAKEQAKENTFALMWLGIPVIVVLSVGAMYTCFAWSKAPRRRHVVVKDGKPKLPEDEVIVTNTVKEDFPGSPNRYLYSSYTSPSPSDLEWEHVWDFLTNSEFENWQCTEKFKRRRPRRRRLDLRPSRLLRGRKNKLKDKFETSEYFSEGDSSSARWKHQDDNEWSRERIKCLGKKAIDIESEASQPVDSLEEFSDVTSVADSKDGDKCSNSFDHFSPDAISSPHAGYRSDSKYYSFVYRSNLNLKDREQIHLSFKAKSRLASERNTLYSSCSSLETIHRQQPSRIHKTKYASTSCLVTIGRRSKTRLVDRKWSSKISLASSMRTVLSSGFLDKTWSSKYASSLSISTLTRSVSTKTINDDVDCYHSGCENSVFENLSSEQGYGTFESSAALSNDIMDMNITSSDTGLVENGHANISNGSISSNIPTYDMNLLTPSKKPIGAIEKPIESSSLDNSWMDDFEKDLKNFESLLCESSQIPAVDRVLSDWQEKSKAFLEDTYIMNMDLIGNDTQVSGSANSINSLPDANGIAEDNIFSDAIHKTNTLNTLSCSSIAFSSEDLGIDMRTGSYEDESLIPGISSSDEKQFSSSAYLKTHSVENFGDIETESEHETILQNVNKQKTPNKGKIVSQKRGCHQNRVVSFPRTSTVKRKTKVLKKKIERTPLATTGLSVRSPTKHMRSYIVLRQQSRYSENERSTVTIERQESLSGSESRCIRRVNKAGTRKPGRRANVTDVASNQEENQACEQASPCQENRTFEKESDQSLEDDVRITSRNESEGSDHDLLLAVKIEVEEEEKLSKTIESCLKGTKDDAPKTRVTFTGLDDVTVAGDSEDDIRRSVESRHLQTQKGLVA
ncbi:uncharacterized protein LOC135681293 isoform X2 [Rhopilema esculentum]|uniref:uncharacterized protein LOC135681293 isoform X2 n=1 Tax=Rhopilema esculentum TaxID=499914 RepID=UPI0031DA4F19